MQPGAVAVGIYGFRMKGRASSCSAGRQARLAGWQLPHMGTYSWLGVEKATKSAVWLSHTHNTDTLNCVRVRLSPSSGSAGSSGTVSAGCEGRANMPTSGTHVTKQKTQHRHASHASRGAVLAHGHQCTCARPLCLQPRVRAHDPAACPKMAPPSPARADPSLRAGGRAPQAQRTGGGGCWGGLAGRL